MSLSQPSRTIVVEPVQASMTASGRAAPPLNEPPRHVEPPAVPSPLAESAAGR